MGSGVEPVGLKAIASALSESLAEENYWVGGGSNTAWDVKVSRKASLSVVASNSVIALLEVHKEDAIARMFPETKEQVAWVYWSGNRWYAELPGTPYPLEKLRNARMFPIQFGGFGLQDVNCADLANRFMTGTNCVTLVCAVDPEPRFCHDDIWEERVKLFEDAILAETEEVGCGGTVVACDVSMGATMTRAIFIPDCGDGGLESKVTFVPRSFGENAAFTCTIQSRSVDSVTVVDLSKIMQHLLRWRVSGSGSDRKIVRLKDL